MVPEIWSATEFFLILDQFLPFYFSNNLENQNFDKMKKWLGDIIILHIHMFHEWKSYMMDGSRDMELDR